MTHKDGETLIRFGWGQEAMEWLAPGSAAAVINSLSGGRSVQATAAEAAFLHFQDALLPALLACQSGQELVQRGYVEDVALAVELNSSVCAPRLVNGAYIGRSLEVTDERSGD